MNKTNQSMNPDYEPEVEEDEISIPIEILTFEWADYQAHLNNIKAYCKQTGEIIEGVQIEEGSEKLYVK